MNKKRKDFSKSLKIYKFYFYKAPCTSIVCENGGSCINFDNSTSPYYYCDCINGYTNTFCETRKTLI
jgi:hypothetical protein